MYLILWLISNFLKKLLLNVRKYLFIIHTWLGGHVVQLLLIEMSIFPIIIIIFHSLRLNVFHSFGTFLLFQFFIFFLSPLAFQFGLSFLFMLFLFLHIITFLRLNDTFRIRVSLSFYRLIFNLLFDVLSIFGSDGNFPMQPAICA